MALASGTRLWGQRVGCPSAIRNTGFQAGVGSQKSNPTFARRIEIKTHEISTVLKCLTRGKLSWGCWKQLGHRQPGDACCRIALTHNPKSLALTEVAADAADGMYGGLLTMELGANIRGIECSGLKTGVHVGRSVEIAVVPIVSSVDD